MLFSKIFSGEKKINFVGTHKIALALSVVVLVSSIVSIVVRGFNFGIDFTGGVLLETEIVKDISLQDIRKTLSKDLIESDTKKSS